MPAVCTFKFAIKFEFSSLNENDVIDMQHGRSTHMVYAFDATFQSRYLPRLTIERD